MSFCSERWSTVRSTNTFSFLSFYIIFFLLRVSKGPILFRVRRMLVWGLSKKKKYIFYIYNTYAIYTLHAEIALKRIHMACYNSPWRNGLSFYYTCVCMWVCYYNTFNDLQLCIVILLVYLKQEKYIRQQGTCCNKNVKRCNRVKIFFRLR